MKLVKMTELDKALAAQGLKVATESDTQAPRKPMSAAVKAKISKAAKARWAGKGPKTSKTL